jgi:Mrp family chromosome partitioning ATPase
MLKSAGDAYDYILIDLPPILAVVDVKAAAHLFDVFIMVIEWGSTSLDDVSNAVAISDNFSVRLIGTILNKARVRRCIALKDTQTRSTVITQEKRFLLGSDQAKRAAPRWFGGCNMTPPKAISRPNSYRFFCNSQN